jgi:hypothetical protein
LLAEHVAKDVAKGFGKPAEPFCARAGPRMFGSTPAWPYWSYAARFCGSDNIS